MITDILDIVLLILIGGMVFYSLGILLLYLKIMRIDKRVIKQMVKRYFNPWILLFSKEDLKE